MIPIMSRSFFPGPHVRTWRLTAREILFRQDDPVTHCYEVITGRVRLMRHLPDGKELTLQIAGPGDLLAEASLFAERYHCDAMADRDTQLSGIDRTVFRQFLMANPETLLALTRRVCREVQTLRGRIELSGLRKVSERLDAWLVFNGEPEGRSWKDVASEIGVSPEALYRELSRRRSA